MRPLGTHFSEIQIKIQNIKMHVKVSAKWQLFCRGGGELNSNDYFLTRPGHPCLHMYDFYHIYR